MLDVILPIEPTASERARWGAPTRRTLRNASLVLVDNTKLHASLLLEAMADALQDSGRVASHVTFHKTTAARALSSDEAASLSSNTDAVLSGVGDCGACSACSVHDAVLFRERGIPALVVVTQPFAKLAAHTARNLGHPDLAIIVVEHPLYVRDPQWMRDTALSVSAQIDAALFADDRA